MIINDERELAYVALIDEIKPIPNYDRVEYARINGWWVIVSKSENLKVGDKVVYFEVDSKVPEADERFSFLSKRKHKVKTIKMCGVYSQGLILPVRLFPELGVDPEIGLPCTKKLNITYAVAADNERKAKNPNSKFKYQSMMARHKKLFSYFPFSWMRKREWGRKILFFFFGKKKYNTKSWPSHICKRTDVERWQNMPWVLNDKQPYVATEKVDGSSFTVAVERKFGRYKYYVCSRNVVFPNKNNKCFYDSNIYWEAYEKYSLKEIITAILNEYNLPNLAIQAEVFGDGVQKRNYSMTNGHREIRVFHMVSDGIKFPMDKTVRICEKYGLPHVHIIDDNYILPDTGEELQSFVEGGNSAIDNGPREGIVFYDKDTGQRYFKYVSPDFLLKYHS